MQSRNSLAASEYARKRQEQLRHAQELRLQRDFQSKSLQDIENSRKSITNSTIKNTETSVTIRCADGKTSLDSRVCIDSFQDTKGNVVAERIRIRKNNQTNYHSISSQESLRAQPKFTSSFSTNDCIFLSPPEKTEGHLIDISNQQIVCSSSDNCDEIIFGSTDHALYSCNINEILMYNKKPVKMYSKAYGHSEWITAVSHLPSFDGRVLSGGMDGKLCLWDSKNRQKCVNLPRGSSKSITKIASGKTTSTALCCAYDGKTEVYSLNHSLSPVSILTSSALSSTEPIIQCLFDEINSSFITGNRVGFIHEWDIVNSRLTSSIRAHPTAVTCMLYPNSHPNLLVTGGADGFVKLFDRRQEQGSGLISKSPSHQFNGNGVPVVELINPSNSHYLISGGCDGNVIIHDLRKEFEILSMSSHCQGGVSAMRLVGEDCLVVSDCSGKILFYNIRSHSSENLIYGLGASSIGSVTTIDCLDNKIITSGQDGNIIIFTYP